MKLRIFTPDQLAALIEEATIDKTEEQWHEQFLKGVSLLIQTSPIRYRSFGPFWWPLKKYLLDAGLIAGEPVDPDLFEQVSMGSKTLDLAAAFAYEDWSSSNMIATCNIRTLETAEGETIDYQVIDEELEALIAFS